MPRSPARTEALFTDALALPLTDRAAFLDRACGADAALRAELVALLAAHEDPVSLTSAPLPTRTSLAREEQPSDWIGLSAVGLAKAGRYRLLQKIGEGGCGVVWMAEQEEPVRRRVALKVIKLGMDTRAVIARFEAERQALALMDHPHIARVFDAGSTDTGRPFFVMELVRGIPITKYCDEQQLTPAARLELFIKVCHAVQHAHQKGVIHRDLKPSNILVTVNDGQPTPKIIDFGIAKATQGRLTDATLFTAFEQFIGTPAYMSPEQAEMSSLDIDTRSDIYSLGVLLYELLTGRPPFDPKHFAQAGVDQIRQQIREKEPPRPSARWRTLADAEQTTVARQRGTLPAQLSGLLRGDLDWIVMRCLEKDRTRRYETANGLAMDVQRHLRNEPVVARPPSTVYLLQKLLRRHRFGFAAAAAVLVVVIAGALTTAAQATRALRAELEQNELRESTRQAKEHEATARQAAEAEHQRSERQRWARQHMLPEISRLIDANDIPGAYTVALEAGKHLADDQALADLWPRVSMVVSIETTPPGAEVFFKPYLKPTAKWELLGKSPLKDIRLPRTACRWQFKLEGYAPIERASVFNRNNQIAQFFLDPPGVVPLGMERVGMPQEKSPADSADTQPSVSEKSVPAQVGSFFIDRHEVTNREFKVFVDRGGYSNGANWRQPFLKDGKAVPWAEAVARFRDATGRPGPATWRNGTFPEGEDEHPVAGVSWFEAAAYAESVGKRLPSIHHWRRAASSRGGAATAIVSLSNYGSRGTARVESYQGISGWGAYDMAGNVKEWCWNEAGSGQHYILGGAFDEPVYQFTMTDAQSPWDRSANNGIRCIQLLAGAVTSALDQPVVPSQRDFSHLQPVSDEVYRAFLGQFSYDRGPLDPQVETVEETSQLWRREVVSVSAAYGKERLPIVLFLPKGVPPPYQAVVFAPGAPALMRGGLPLLPGRCSFVVESGRAVIYPIYKGTYERSEASLSEYLQSQSAYRDLVVHWSKDLARTIDFLGTRSEIRTDKLAYFGTSFGALMGSVLLAVESRFQAGVLAHGGMASYAVAPEVDQINFAPRITTPTLMLNGRYDFTFPEPGQRQLFRLLGTAPEHKRLKHIETGHGVFPDELFQEALAWLDRYLGPVR